MQGSLQPLRLAGSSFLGGPAITRLSPSRLALGGCGAHWFLDSHGNIEPPRGTVELHRTPGHRKSAPPYLYYVVLCGSRSVAQTGWRMRRRGLPIPVRSNTEKAVGHRSGQRGRLYRDDEYSYLYLFLRVVQVPKRKVRWSTSKHIHASRTH